MGIADDRFNAAPFLTEAGAGADFQQRLADEAAAGPELAGGGRPSVRINWRAAGHNCLRRAPERRRGFVVNTAVPTGATPALLELVHCMSDPGGIDYSTASFDLRRIPYPPAKSAADSA